MPRDRQTTEFPSRLAQRASRDKWRENHPDPIADLLTLRPAEDWHEEEGPVLWHHIGEYGDICEAPIVADGVDLDGHQPWEGYYSHWSRLPRLPRFPLRSLKIAPPGTLICDLEHANGQ